MVWDIKLDKFAVREVNETKAIAIGTQVNK